MILDHLDQAQRYVAVHPGFWKAFQFLRDADLDGLESGTHVIDGARMFAIVATDPPKGPENAVFESHRKFIDIQFTVAGTETIGWSTSSECLLPLDYDEKKDLRFYDDRPQRFIAVPADHYAVFFPDDVHAPLAGTESPKKVVLKIAVNW